MGSEGLIKISMFDIIGLCKFLPEKQKIKNLNKWAVLMFCCCHIKKATGVSAAPKFSSDVALNLWKIFLSGFSGDSLHTGVMSFIKGNIDDASK